MKKLLVVLSIFLFATLTEGQGVEMVLGDPSPDEPSITIADNSSTIAITKSTSTPGVKKTRNDQTFVYPNGNIRINRNAYILSFNPRRLTADWVNWHVQSSDLGNLKKANSFRPDPLLPKHLQVGTKLFGKVGDRDYDRGHLCPDADRNRLPVTQSETMFMSNMQPQLGNLNKGAWKSLEEYIREKVRGGKEAYIYAGCNGGDTKLFNGMTIPSHCWKVAMLLPRGNNDKALMSSAPQTVIAVYMPNDGSTRGTKWTDHVKSVNYIETTTGLKFFKTLPDKINEIVKSSEYKPIITEKKVRLKKKPTPKNN